MNVLSLFHSFGLYWTHSLAHKHASKWGKTKHTALTNHDRILSFMSYRKLYWTPTTIKFFRAFFFQLWNDKNKTKFAVNRNNRTINGWWIPMTFWLKYFILWLIMAIVCKFLLLWPMQILLVSWSLLQVLSNFKNSSILPWLKKRADEKGCSEKPIHWILRCAEWYCTHCKMNGNCT